MKQKLLLFVSLVVLTPWLLQAQGTFQNLDFEQATIVPQGGAFPEYFVASNALPGWTVYIGSNSFDAVYYNNVTAGGAAVSLHDTTDSLKPLQGNYSVLLQHSSGNFASAGIGQVGQLPANAKSIVFDSGFSGVWSTVYDVTFAGNPIPLFDIGTASGYFIVGGDISAYAGQTGELRFTALLADFGPYLDDIRFSNQAVPEPGVLGLSVIGGLLLGWRLRRNSPRP